MTYLANMSRNEGDPRILSTGPSSLGSQDRMARGLGWFSLGLGLAELLAPHSITRALGMEGREDLVRAYGAREIAAGVMSLSVDRELGLWSRVAGDGLDVATLMGAMREDNPKRGNAAAALALVLGVTLLDAATAASLRGKTRRSGRPRDYGNRSGYPKGLSASRGAARDLVKPDDMRAAPAVTPPPSRPEPAHPRPM
ncbi:hypothetical protein NK718_01115 [Alsobacter sp. SYSU M60028]|uniref:Cyclase dehydrase n=1 Tax=Alsobacter ponti TaxID=2962936 RepID=A0ABT1L7T0_9HYPH|nr:hypothetical protein [Alsobacter ponti]MCP8937106.1 hypothetical protein [Alsobacter ponti]